jgi:hypothetical protein
LLDVVAGAIEVGVTHLSAYAFSTENWKRSPDEVRFLMGFNRDVIRRRRDQLHEWGVRMRWVGRRPRLWGSVIKELEVAQELTRHNSGLTLYFCVNYGGRAEIGDAARRLAEDVARGRLKASSVDEKTLARYLPEPDMPDVDLFVRSSGSSGRATSCCGRARMPRWSSRIGCGPTTTAVTSGRPSRTTSTGSAATVGLWTDPQGRTPRWVQFKSDRADRASGDCARSAGAGRR